MTKSAGGAGRKGRARVQTFDQFSAQNGGIPEPDQSFMRARANVSNRTQRSQDIRYRQEVDAKYSKTIELRAQYKQSVASGAIREPTRLEKLLAAAKGHPDNQATQAARRLLNKQGIKF